MGYKVIFAPQAITRLEEIVRYIAADPAAAQRFGMYLLDRAELLADYPELGTPYRKRRNVRRLWGKAYFIYYRLRPDAWTRSPVLEGLASPATPALSAARQHEAKGN